LSTYNPFKLYKGAKEMGKRQSDKGIEGNLKGEGIVQGGIMVFNANGELTYVYKEMSGYEIPSDDIKAALDGIIG